MKLQILIEQTHSNFFVSSLNKIYLRNLLMLHSKEIEGNQEKLLYELLSKIFWDKKSFPNTWTHVGCSERSGAKCPSP